MAKIIYEEVTTDFGSVVIKRTNADGSETWIPTDPANSDYQAYLNPDKVEHLTEIPPQAALSTPSVDEAKAK